MEEEKILAEIKLIGRDNPESGKYEIEAIATFKVKTLDDLRDIEASLLELVAEVNKKEQELIESINK